MAWTFAEQERALALMDERLSFLEGAVRPQALRQRLERTFDPRGGEPRIIDEDGATLDYAPAVEFTGNVAVTLDAPRRRVVVDVPAPPAPTPTADLVWADTFATDLFPTAYRDVFNLTTASHLVSWNPATGNGGYALKTGAFHNTVQSLRYAESGNTSLLRLLARSRTLPAHTGVELVWDTSSGALTIRDANAAATLATAAAPFTPTAATDYWLMFAVDGDRAYGAVVSVAPAALSTAAQVLASVSVTLADGAAQQLIMDAGVGFNVLCFGTPLVTVDDYQIWRV